MSTAPATAAASALQPTSTSPIKLDNIKPLRGIENYGTWSRQVSLVLFAIDAKSLVLDNVIPAGMTPEVARGLKKQALLIIIQLVSEPIMAQISSFTGAHKMWVHLRQNYYAGTCFSFGHQMQVISSLHTSLG